MASELFEIMNQLTPREKQVIEMLKRDASLTYRGIGSRLGISQHTVNNHLRRVYEKTGIRSKTALVATLYGSAMQK